jgi:orotate phosphoribosyltransferase
MSDDPVGRARALLREKAILELDEPVELASGAMSRVFVDGKAGLAAAEDLRLACRALLVLADQAGIAFDAVGGMTMGADHLAVGVALAADRSWFFVRKEPKGRGTGRQIEGAALGPDTRVLVVEDVVSTGGSMIRAIDVIEATGATVAAAATLIDRGDAAGPVLAGRGIPLLAIATYRDYGMDPVTEAAPVAG